MEEMRGEAEEIGAAERKMGGMVKGWRGEEGGRKVASNGQERKGKVRSKHRICFGGLCV
jgi:hypothetical protein